MKEEIWQGKKDSNLRMSESKSDALTNLATPLHWTLHECNLRKMQCLRALVFQTILEGMGC
jgi:hypothetical protein